MAHPFQLITLSPHCAEKERLGEAGQPLAQRVVFALPGQDEFDLAASLYGQLEEGQPPAVVVVPTSRVLFRRINLPFSDPVQVRQVLASELEADLLDPLESLAYTYRLEPMEGGGVQAAVFLLERAYLEGLVAAIQLGGGRVIRVTFSAQALLMASPPPPGLHFQVYLGLDELFVSLIRDGKLMTAKSLPNIFIPMAFNHGVADQTDPRKVLALLEKFKGDPDVAGGLARWRELKGLGELIALFMKAQSLGRPHTVSFHGLYAPLFNWVGELGQAQVVEKAQPAAKGRKMVGLSEELAPVADALLKMGEGVFYKKRRRLSFNLGRLPRPVAASVVLAALLLAVWSARLLVGTGSGMDEARMDQELRLIMARELPPGFNPAVGVRFLKDKVEQARRQAGAVSAPQLPLPAVDVLEQVSLLVKEHPGMVVKEWVYNSSRFSIKGHSPGQGEISLLAARLEGEEWLEGKKANIQTGKESQGYGFSISFSQ